MLGSVVRRCSLELAEYLYSYRSARLTLWLDPGQDWDEDKVGVPRDVRVNLMRPPIRLLRIRWARRKALVILTVDAAAMHAAGHPFYQAAKGV